MFTVVVVRYDPAHVGKNAGRGVGSELRGRRNVLRPQTGIANVIDGVQGGPLVPGLALRRGIVPPGKPGGVYQVRQRREIKTRIEVCKIVIAVISWCCCARRSVT